MPWVLKFWTTGDPNATPPVPAVTWNLTGAVVTPYDVPPGQVSDITNALNAIAGLSSYAAGRLNNYGQDIRVGYDPGSPGGADRFAADKFIVIDVAAANNFHFFNSFGKLVQGNLGLTLMHELAHIYLNTTDSPRGASDATMDGMNFDFRGAVIDEQNKIAEDGNLTDQIQVSYQAAGLGLDSIFVANVSYTDNNEIDVARIDTAFANSMDHTLNTTRVRDLLFGMGATIR